MRIMKKFILFVIMSVTAFVSAADECRAQYDVLKFGDFGVQTVRPVGYGSVYGKVWVDVDNPLVGFTVTEIDGKLYKNGVALIEGRANDYYVPSGGSRIFIDGQATLCPSASLFDVLGLIFFDPNQYTVDIKAVVTDDGGQPVEMEVKDIPVMTLLKKDKKENIYESKDSK